MLTNEMFFNEIDRQLENAVRRSLKEIAFLVLRELLAWVAEDGRIFGIEIVEKGAPRNTGCLANLLNSDVGESTLIHQVGGGVLDSQARLEALLLA